MQRKITTCDKAARARVASCAAPLLLLIASAAHAQSLKEAPGRSVAAAARASAQATRLPAGATPPSQPASAQPRVLTLDAALEIAEARSEQIQIAEAGVARAESDQVRARSEWLPQISASASYDRALASEFEGLFDGNGPTCIPFTLNPQAPLDDRVAEIERALRDCPPTGNLFGGGGEEGEDRALPFGRANTYRLNLISAQNVYTGGRLTAQREQARLGRANAGLTLASTRAQLFLDVAQAYYDAVLSERLVTIAEATFVQAERTADQVRQQRETGRVAEFDLVRALVTRDNQRPEVIRRRNARDVAHLRLKQLLDLPLETELQFVASLEDAVLPVPAMRFASAITAAEAGAAEQPRTAIAQAQNELQQSEAAIRVVRAQRLPSVSLTSSYGRVAYPSGFQGFADWRTNWTVGIAAQVPLFTGGRIRADEMAARANLAETRARLQLTRELATLDGASARLELANARSAWQATAGTVQQAQRAYEIADLRYREGLSTQLELSDARLLLQQAQANQAQAARDVQIARVRLALLPELPITNTGAGTPQRMQAPFQQPQTTPPTGLPSMGTGSAGAAGAAGSGAQGVPRGGAQ